MDSIRIIRKVKSSVVRLKELEKFRNEEVEILITPIERHLTNTHRDKNDLLKISVWDTKESNVRAKSWKIKNY